LHFDSFGEENYTRPQNRNKAVEILLYDRLQFVIGCAAKKFKRGMDGEFLEKVNSFFDGVFLIRTRLARLLKSSAVRLRNQFGEDANTRRGAADRAKYRQAAARAATEVLAWPLFRERPIVSIIGQ
jgi:hypothetical protein